MEATERIKVTVTKAEKEILAEAAAKLGTPLATYLRQCALREAAKQ